MVSDEEKEWASEVPLDMQAPFSVPILPVQYCQMEVWGFVHIKIFLF